MRRVRTLDTDRRQLELKKLQKGNFDLDADGRPSLRDHRPLSFDTAIAAHGRLMGGSLSREPTSVQTIYQ